MYSTDVYSYIPQQHVVLICGNSPRSYNIVYAKTLRLQKGVDNIIQFRFINQEQKPVDITSATTAPNQITIRVLSDDGTMVLLQAALTPIYAVTGIAQFQLLASELEGIDAQKAQYSIEIPQNGFNLPVYLDGNSSARGVMWIEDSILPQHVQSFDLTIPSHPAPASNTVTFTSSIYSTSYDATLTIQTYFANYSGTVQVQGNTDPNDTNGWYNIGNLITYVNQANTDYYTIEGYHPYIQLQMEGTQGDVTDILVR